MAQAIKCDRCGKFSEGKGYFLVINPEVISYRIRGGTRDKLDSPYISSSQKHEICEECMIDFNSFVKYFKNE